MSKHGCGQQFSLSQDDLLLKKGEQVFGKAADIVKSFLQEVGHQLFGFRFFIQFINDIGILLSQLVDGFIGRIGVPFIQVVGNFHQVIGGARHS
ncbi:MAG: hypothetical protein BWY72_02164 [Bacteroidetes bacterium ADurb.Bin416]|nr:MAG: hypothetical protein BWY72_02164 [Bacteroidetes bacterium ADurb.Bin416]